ncbi:MAG: pyridoxal phosphate-dependent aminotransferase [Bdellovibrionales bacterium]|nr:pyridoxal phosphate-dependent aminotransferase [Bdellovibrionales bacterium]
MQYVRMPIEIEAPEQLGYHTIDCNLTESSYTDFKFGELGLNLDDLILAYIDHVGHPGLRKLLSADTGGKIGPDRILLTAGAATALFIISTSLLDRGDEMVVVRPNYGTNLETPRAIGAVVKIVDLHYENSWKIDPESVMRVVTSKTKFVSITVPHNPTGTMMSLESLQAIVKATGELGIPLLVDETYREMAFCLGGALPYAATLGDHVISVSSFSKTFGLPGIRLGWLMTQNAKLFEKFFAGKEQIQICNSALDEEIGFQFYQKRAQFLPRILENLKRRHDMVSTWMTAHPYLEWTKPTGGCVGFPRFKNANFNTEKFYSTLNEEFKTHVGPGHWFEQPKRYFRLGYGWPDDVQLKRGLANIDAAIQKVHK